MKAKPLISAQELSNLLDTARNLVVCDCRFELTNPSQGLQLYNDGHIPGARHVDLDQVLSVKGGADQGRHPLPARELFAQKMAAIGISDDTHVVCYDANDSMFAARLWWMLRWIGHDNVSVLDGGFKLWQQAGYEVTTEPPQPAKEGRLTLRDSLTQTVDYEEVLANISAAERLVLDARSPDRFRGENETLDPIGGHIPGAANRFFKDNLQADGTFKDAETLHKELTASLQGQKPESVISQCGSGVTACHNLLAMEVAGLSGAALYPGSWSQWSNTGGAPVARD
jgi:thiosulfate/3-mercaptopyruvate sulfurtransferase